MHLLIKNNNKYRRNKCTTLLLIRTGPKRAVYMTPRYLHAHERQRWRTKCKAQPAPGDERSGRRQSANCFGLCHTREFLEGAVKAADTTAAATAEKGAANEKAKEALAATRHAALVEARDSMGLTFAELLTDADVTVAALAKIPMPRLAALIRLLSGDAENVTSKAQDGKRVALKAADLQQMAVPYVARWIRDGRLTMPVNFGALGPSQG